MNESYGLSFVVTNGKVESIESLKDKTEVAEVTEMPVVSALDGSPLEVVSLLQMGKSERYEAFAITTGKN